MESFILNNDMRIPAVGIGVYQVRSADCGPALAEAFRAGYRSVDTANVYLNERAVGQAIRASGLPREQVFLTTKLWSSDYGYTKTPAAIDKTLARLGTDHIDLLLLHQQYGDYNGAWRAMQEAVQAGKVRAIGVSNFNLQRLQDLTSRATTMPAVAQVECHPYYQQWELKELLERHGTVVESWYPLGHGDTGLLAEPLFSELGRKYGKSAVQVILRWHVQAGNVVIPGSTNPAHIRSNIDLFDFALTEQEMAQVLALDKGKRFHRIPEFVERIVFQAVHLNYDRQR